MDSSTNSGEDKKLMEELAVFFRERNWDDGTAMDCMLNLTALFAIGHRLDKEHLLNAIHEIWEDNEHLMPLKREKEKL
jgi:hypothetical protein